MSRRRNDDFRWPECRVAERTTSLGFQGLIMSLVLFLHRHPEEGQLIGVVTCARQQPPAKLTRMEQSHSLFDIFLRDV